MVKGKIYLIWEPGMNEWIQMGYVGYNKLTGDYIFVSPDDNEMYIHVNEEEVWRIRRVEEKI